MMGHAIDQARERWGFDLTKDDLSQVRRWCQDDDPRAVLIQDWRDGFRSFAALVRDAWLPVVVAPNGYIVTVLGRGALVRHWRALDARREELRRLDLDAGPPSRERNAG